jgi:hypothetical protein
MEEQSENNYLVSTYTYQIEKALVDMEASIDQVTLIKDRETGSSSPAVTRFIHCII